MMKSLKDYMLSESVKDEPEVLFDMDESSYDDEDSIGAELELFKDYLNKCEELSGVNSVIYYKASTSIRAKRNTNLEFDEATTDTSYLFEQILSKMDYGYVITLEDDYTLGVTAIISGPRQSPSYYIRFSTVTEDEILDDDVDPKFPDDFVNISKVQIG